METPDIPCRPLLLAGAIASVGIGAWGESLPKEDAGALWEESMQAGAALVSDISARSSAPGQGKNPALVVPSVKRGRSGNLEGIVEGRASGLPVSLTISTSGVTGRAGGRSVDLVISQGRMTGRAGGSSADLAISPGRVTGRAAGRSVDLTVSNGHATGHAGGRAMDVVISQEHAAGRANGRPVDLTVSQLPDLPLRDEVLAALVASFGPGGPGGTPDDAKKSSP